MSAFLRTAWSCLASHGTADTDALIRQAWLSRRVACYQYGNRPLHRTASRPDAAW